ncbi:MAG: protein-tyrosine-phosphatase, partial [Nannocystaceae bacterium]
LVEAVPPVRGAILVELAVLVVAARAAGRMASLLFICTHNSRRSHMSQLWAAAAAAWYGIDGVETFSGGTEATAFNPRAVAAMQRAGFAVDDPGGDNPRYSVTFGPEASPMSAFSKTWQDEVNPDEGFAAVMTCSQADEACPFVHGSKLRIALPYVDPKVSDGTPDEAATYDERAQQIATEMFYLFSRVAQMT